MPIVGDKTDESAQVRELLRTETLNRTRPPKWLRAAVKEAVSQATMPKPDFPINSAGAALEHATKTFGRAWADHTGTLKDFEGTELLVSEPYAERINGKALAQLEQFCQALNASYVFSANSEWYPGRTLRILITHNRE